MKRAIHLIQTAFLLAIVSLASGCSWFASADPAQPVSELVEIAAPNNGSVAWAKDIEGESEYVVLRPAVHNGIVYVADAEGEIAALDAATGTQVWRQDLDAEITGGVGVGSGLALVGTEEGGVAAVDANTGSVVWRTELSSEVLSAPTAHSGVVAVRTNDGKVVGLDASTGAELWSFEREPPVLTLRGTASPVVADGRFICGMDGGKLVSLDTNSGIPFWEISVAYPTGRTDLDRVVDIDGDPLVAGNAVFVSTFQGHMAAVERENGQVAWSIPFSAYNGLAASSQAIIATDDKSVVYAIDPGSGSRLWKQDALSGRKLSPPASIGGYVAIGDLEGFVHWLDATSGELVGRNEVADSPIRARPVVADGLVYFMGSEGEMAAVRPPGG